MTQALEFFATDDAVSRLQESLAAASGSDRLPALIAVAWQMRQRDTRLALQLADEAQAILDAGDLGHNDKKREEQFDKTPGFQARLMLIRGEAKFLWGDLEASAALAASALQGFATCHDALGRADAHWLQHTIALGQGDNVRRAAELNAMALAAQHDDPARVTMAHALLATRALYHDVAAAKQQWGPQFSSGTANMHPAAASFVNGFFATAAEKDNEHVESIRYYGMSYSQALATGQIRRAVVMATNLGVEFNNLNDHHAALDWMQRGLDLARPRAWPGTLGVALLQTAWTMRELQRFDSARELLGQAMVLMALESASRNYAVALRYLADVELVSQRYTHALECFELLEQRATALGATDLLTNGLRGQAKVLLELGQPQAALVKAHAALAAARSSAIHEFDALWVLADIYARHVLPNPPGMLAGSASLHYLQQALDATTKMEGYTVPGDLLEAMASEHAKVGNPVQAYESALQAIQAHAKIRSTEASNRASAMQVTHETQRAQAEEAHQRTLAKAHAERADLLQQANAAYHAVLENAQDAIVLTDHNGHINHWNRQAALTFGWTLEEASGKNIIETLFPPRFHEEVATIIKRQHDVPQETPRLEIMALRRDASEFPIELSVTSMNVRSQFECSFFIRDITQRLKAETEISESLARQQELTDLKSRFVSMASHEFRTPLATILSSADLLKLYGARMDDQKREECFDFIASSVHRMKDMLEDVLLIGTTDAGFSQFKPQAHALRPLCKSIVEEVKRGVAKTCPADHAIEIRIASDVRTADVDERWFRHIFGNLLSNAVKYSPEGGAVTFEVKLHADELEFMVADQGIGLPVQDIPRLFEPFFRASNSGSISGTGLGLSIVKRAVEIHSGRIWVESELGKGTTFKVRLPTRQTSTPAL
jgi:PAS domain S-box-containing protein